MITYTIQEILDWAPSFSLLEIAIQKECFLCFICVLKVSGVDTDPERRFVFIKVILIYLLAPFIVQKLKKILPVYEDVQIQSYEDVQFVGPKWPIFPNENCFRKPVHEPCFFYSCLSACQESKSDIKLLVKYWWLKNTEISLGKSHFCL